jgi:hypothetical protein
MRRAFDFDSSTFALLDPHSIVEIKVECDVVDGTSRQHVFVEQIADAKNTRVIASRIQC